MNDAGPVTTPARRVSCQVDLQVTEAADLVFSVAVADEHRPLSEELSVTVDGAGVPVTELVGDVGTRLHRVPETPPGPLRLEYAATVAPGPGAAAASELETVEFRRQSRYCDSDRLAEVAASHFGGYQGEELVRQVVAWTLGNIVYAPGSTGPLDGALETYLHRQGVCRDTAHLVVTFLRARGLPARLVSVYAPGLFPMDFHAVAEVCLDGTWYVLDGTGLAPRLSLVRIATGRDAADTAFLTVLGGRAQLGSVTVQAITDGPLPTDDGVSLVRLS